MANPASENCEKLEELSGLLTKKGFIIQTKRICSPDVTGIYSLEKKMADKNYLFAVGSLKNDFLENNLYSLLSSKLNFHLDLTKQEITAQVVNLLFKIIKINPKKTFEFAYVFNNAKSSPYFPSASYEKDGFSLGLQPTDLSLGCKSIAEWLTKIRVVWEEINLLFKDQKDFLGIDSSIAPLNNKRGSLVGFIKRLGFDFSYSAATSIYLEITTYLKENNPKPVGLCGMMLPCLEDLELAKEYGKGNFSIERNIYLSLHCGLGIDTYPIGIDEDQMKVAEILMLVQGLSDKYNKPLSVRFVSDGKAKIGEKTNFHNQYLRDVIVRKL